MTEPEKPPKCTLSLPPSQLPLYVFSNRTCILTRKIVPKKLSYSPRPLWVFCEWVRLEKNPGGHMKAAFPRLFELYNVQLPNEKKVTLIKIQKGNEEMATIGYIKCLPKHSLFLQHEPL